MQNTLTVVIKPWKEITPAEYQLIDAAKMKEFSIIAMSKVEFQASLFFLLKSGDEILAHGQLKDIPTIELNGEKFDIKGISGLVATPKHKKYGRQLLAAMLDYIKEGKYTALGFVSTKNIEFSKKSGLKVSKELIQKLVYSEKGKEVMSEENAVAYVEGKDKFVSKVLASDEIVNMPRKPNW
jgi:hypothetical protein